MNKKRVKELNSKAEALKNGETVNGMALPFDVRDFYGKADQPYGYNKKHGEFVTAGPNWNYPKSDRLKMSGEVEFGYASRPSKFQSLVLDGKYAAFIHNVNISFLNDRNAYVTWVNISVASKDDPWNEGCRLVEEVLDGVVDSERNEVEDSDAGATIAYSNEENLLKAVDALVAKFGENILFSYKDVA